MRAHTAITALAAAALLALTGCAAEDTDPGTDASKTGQADEVKTDDGPATDSDSDAEDAAAQPETATLPDMTGKGLQAAQDEAQAAGFFSLTSSDATGADRMQMFDRSWKVCSQTPQPGEHPTDTTIDFSTVKLSEEC